MAFYFVYYAISFIKNRFVAESLKSFILVLGIVFSCIDIFGSYFFIFLCLMSWVIFYSPRIIKRA